MIFSLMDLDLLLNDWLVDNKKLFVKLNDKEYSGRLIAYLIDNDSLCMVLDDNELTIDVIKNQVLVSKLENGRTVITIGEYEIFN